MTLTALAAAAVVLAVVPAAVDRWARGRAAPASLVALGLVTLGGLAVLPVALATCLGLLSAHGHGGNARVGAAVLGALVMGLTVARGAATVVRARRTWRSVASSAEVAARSLAGGPAVVPHDEPLAFAAGSTVVVSGALLEVLAPDQAEAVLAHETAHVEGGHPRIAVVAHALRQAVFGIPPARRAEARVRHELEVLADAEAARSLRDPGAVAAALTAMPARRLEPALLGVGDDAVRDRIERLVAGGPPTRWADRVVRAVAATVALAAFAALCAALHLELLWLGVAACGALAGALAWVLHPLAAPRPASG